MRLIIARTPVAVTPFLTAIFGASALRRDSRLCCRDRNESLASGSIDALEPSTLMFGRTG